LERVIRINGNAACVHQKTVEKMQNAGILPKNMIETDPNTGQFYIKLELPETINGKQLSQDDIVLIKYLDESDYSGEERVLVKSIPLTKSFAKVETLGVESRIGHDGKTIHIGNEYEIRYIDKSTPLNTSEKISLKGRIG